MAACLAKVAVLMEMVQMATEWQSQLSCCFHGGAVGVEDWLGGDGKFLVSSGPVIEAYCKAADGFD